jgi:gluconolactonase
VRVYDVRADGSVGPWRPLIELGDDGVPDGLKVASDGSVWIADAIGGRVLVVEPDGRVRHRLEVPLPMVTSLCFGGDDLCDLYVVTGSQGGPNAACGTVYRTRTDVAGLALPPARVELARH